MRLQTKKSSLPLPPSIIGISLISLIFWSTLALTTRMDISFDSIDYSSLAQRIYAHGWIDFLKTGPHREPLYPFVITLAMHLQDLTGLPFDKIMAIFGVIILFITQLLLYRILQLLKISRGLCLLVLTYFFLSPALSNSALSLYSEIITYPIILGIVLANFSAWRAITQMQRRKAFAAVILLGILFTLATLVKGVFECIAPMDLIIIFTAVYLELKHKKTLKTSPLLVYLVTAALFFYIPINAYKWLNAHYNGNFKVTDRGAWLVYGNAERRMEPLTFSRLGAALTYIPGEGFCKRFFSPNDCDFWSFQRSDGLGMKKLHELTAARLPPAETNASLLRLTVQKAAIDPFQYVFMDTLEGIKMFFWESTQIGFVHYPDWIEKIYNNKILNNSLRLIMSLLTWIAVIHLWMISFLPHRHPLVFIIGLLIFLYILFFSFVCILTRYALPMAPLYLIAIGIWLEKILSPKKIS